MRSLRSYATSYTLRQGESELYTLDLNKQMGFYQISEFVSPTDENNFIIEQTNRIGTPKIAAFDKDTGSMLGVFKSNRLYDKNDTPVLEIHSTSKLPEHVLRTIECSGPDDVVAVTKETGSIEAIFCHLPRNDGKGFGLSRRIRQFARQFSSASQDVLEILILDEENCDVRICCAIGVILHNRGGLPLG